MLCPDFEGVLRGLWPAVEQADTVPVYAIVDAARDERIYPMLTGSSCTYSCLYGRRSAVHLAQVAPYLVKLHPQAPYVRGLIENGWGGSWGVFLRSAAPFETLR